MTTVAETKQKRGFPGLAQLQRVGRSLMLPIASLPAAALLLRLGQDDMLGRIQIGWVQALADVFAAGGNALFLNLPVIFALGVAIGYARKADGTTGLAALIGYLVFDGVTDALSPHIGLGLDADGNQVLVNYGVLGGIVIGLTAALLYQKYYRIKLPPYLAFFGGRRFVPIVTAGASLVIGVVFALIYPAFDWLINDQIGGWVTGSTVIGAFVFGTLNRLLLPFGLHHLLNSLPWYQFGSYTGADGTVAHGDIFRFLAGDPTAGTFMTGFFPIMMFALPAAALAMIHTAKPQNRKVIAGVLGSAALVAFVTGVTEPLEYAFVYVAYPLYAIHAVLTGVSMALVNALGIHSGFGFSAGAIDFFLNWGIATKPWLLIPIGLVYAAVYYFLFRFVITKWNLRTPGREDDPEATAAVVGDQAVEEQKEAAAAAAPPTGAAPDGGTGAAKEKGSD
ncbi:PTS transporter subunit EIIC [Isoptericola sp. 4D.3]|jgi:N-acetylglucosamine PTS system EIICBA or EIICB component|uniref:PTS transporter subunit EIIC n=1 Tax=Isoptericola peretonis TaxID=2918523 RepID=A0ABT0J562_9MICO|nr:PTS transporter subunit EIIC [Isoptericola sp. 4D.3]